MAKTKNLDPIPKTSAKIWAPLIDKVDEKIRGACLRRDAYLRRVLEIELGYLDAEVSIPNSEASFNYVASKLKEFRPKLVTISLPTELTERLNEICKRKRIVRDAFFNRLFLLLAASPSDIDRLLFRELEHNWRIEVWSEGRNDGPFFQNVFTPLVPDIDPFWTIRYGLDMLYETKNLEDYVEPTTGKTIKVERDITGAPTPPPSIYATRFLTPQKDERDLVAFSCYLPDSEVPDQPAFSAAKEKLDEELSWMLA